MIKGGYQIIDFSNIMFFAGGGSDDVYLDYTEEELKYFAEQIFNQIFNTSKPIIISGLTIYSEDRSDSYTVYNDFIIFIEHNFIAGTQTDTEYSFILDAPSGYALSFDKVKYIITKETITTEQI